MWIAASFVTMFCFGFNNMIFKWSAGKRISKVHMQFFFYVVAFILSIGFGFLSGMGPFNFLTVLLGVMMGVLNAYGNIQMTKAFEKGPASLTSPLVSMNTIIPILSAALIFQEHITPLKWVGITIILGSAVAIQYSPKTGGNTHYIGWLIRVSLAIFSFGTLGVLMKTSSYLHIDSLNTLVCMYGGGSIYLAFNSIVEKQKWVRSEMKIGLLVGIFSLLGYSNYFFAINTGMASIVFPIVSLNCLIVVLGGCLLYQERLKTYQLFGVFASLLGIVFTKI
jgi:drug/metabolite transporter (DMT)-like permease